MIPEIIDQPLARLFLFMVCLAVCGSLAAGTYYAVADLQHPASSLPPPKNGDCFQSCEDAYNQCVANCNSHGCTNSQRFMCWRSHDNCENDCF